MRQKKNNKVLTHCLLGKYQCLHLQCNANNLLRLFPHISYITTFQDSKAEEGVRSLPKRHPFTALVSQAGEKMRVVWQHLLLGWSLQSISCSAGPPFWPFFYASHDTTAHSSDDHEKDITSDICTPSSMFTSTHTCMCRHLSQSGHKASVEMTVTTLQLCPPDGHRHPWIGEQRTPLFLWCQCVYAQYRLGW